MSRWEQRVKGLQKEVLTWIEDHPTLYHLSPDVYNEIRAGVIRGTFEAYRGGVAGLTTEGVTRIRQAIMGYPSEVSSLGPHTELELLTKLLYAMLSAYRLGVLSGIDRGRE